MPAHRYGPPRVHGKRGEWGRWQSGRRPPWWPENEEWPPKDDAAWRNLRRGFMRRAGCFFAFMVLTLIVLVTIIIVALGIVIGPSGGGVIGALVVLVIFAIVVRLLFRGVRSTAAPVGDLIEASGRVESGELDVQVPERGVREVRALARAFNNMSARISTTERERRRLLAEVSHELRTPLTVISGNVEAMIDGVYPADREHLERIQAETRQLERLIEDLRTISLAETGQLPLEREPTDVVALAREVVEGFEAEADTRGVTLAVEGATDLGEQEVDARRVRQVISNLVSNALRHTPTGGSVSVGVATRPDGGFQLSVRDTGRGMSADATQHAFDRFWRDGEFAGAGLGLAIVHDLVAAHGGEVSIRSEPGLGTEVACTFPADPG
jgi:signal transduction histidine kinase